MNINKIIKNWHKINNLDDKMQELTLLKKLLSIDENTSIQDAYSQIILEYILINNDYKNMKKLVKKGFNLNINNGIILQRAIGSGNIKIIKYCVKQGLIVPQVKDWLPPFGLDLGDLFKSPTKNRLLKWLKKKNIKLDYFKNNNKYKLYDYYII